MGNGEEKARMEMNYDHDEKLTRSVLWLLFTFQKGNELELSNASVIYYAIKSE